MMRRNSVFLVVFLSLCVAGAVAATTVSVPTAGAAPLSETVVVNTPSLNVRAGPGTNYAIVAKVTRGTALTVIDRNPKGDWLKIRTPKAVEGWVSASLVLAPGIVTTLTNRPAAAPAVPSYAGKPFKPNSVTTKFCLLYECFGSGDSPIRQVNAGTPVQVLGTAQFNLAGQYPDLGSSPFLKVRIWDGQYGWLAASNVSVDPKTQPAVSNGCESYDKINWASVVRPTPAPLRFSAVSGGGSGGSSSGGGGSDNCCKHCTNGQACGNSCISWGKTCHQPPGCACQG